MAKLTALRIEKATKPGRYPAGGNLYLVVRSPRAKSWQFRYMRGGRRRDIGLGPVRAVTLAEAREKAAELKRVLHQGGDPLATVRAERRQATGGVTFREAAERYIEAHRAGWRNAKHAAQWPSTLTTYAYPVFGDVDVAEIETDHVLRALQPIWQAKPETAQRVRQRIEAVIDFARARGWREGDNSARWRGHLALMFPARSKVARVEHHAAVPWKELPALWRDLDHLDGMAALALRFVVLTAARSGEVRGARWSEIDMGEAIWTVPAERIKAGREHRVPLSPAALAVLDQVRPLAAGDDDLVFPGARAGRPLSDVAVAKVLRRLGRDGATVHGFRSAFRDWAAERTSFAGDVAEAALAHVVGNKVEAAYRRGDLFAKRRALMVAWAQYLASAPAGKVIPLRRAAAS